MDKRSLIFIVCLSAAFFAVQMWFSPIGGDAVPNTETQEEVETPSSASTFSDETYYVLKTDEAQWVFSTRGGSLAEINLPLRSKSLPHGIVKEIDIDREIIAQSPINARFPLNPYFLAGQSEPQAPSQGGYYPLLRRSILETGGDILHPISPSYYALAVVGSDPSIAEAQYKVTHFDSTTIEFSASTAAGRIVKRYSLAKTPQGPYCLQLDIDTPSKGLWLSSGVLDVEIVGGSYAPLIRFQTSQAGGLDVETIDLPKEISHVQSVKPNWISNSNGFFGIIVDPLEQTGSGYRVAKVEGEEAVTRLSLIDERYNLYPPSKYPGYATYLPLASGKGVFRIFTGPFDESLLKQLDALYEDPARHYNPEYTQAQSIQGWFSFISRPFAKFLFVLMQFFYFITRSWAAAIILLTIALRAMMYPLNAWSIGASVKMQEIAPKIKAIQERHKKDPKKGQLEIMQLYREAKINPFTGCLPILLQMPFLIGMFYLLKSSFPLRGAPFIPGWIDDLAAPDVLFSWGPPLWFIGNEFHLLPILMGLTMFLQQKLTAKPGPVGAPESDTQKQQKVMGHMMSVLFTVMFYSFPSGLNLYFMFSTLLGIGQQMWMTRRLKANT
ncbi:MAG: inner membrane protein oxaA [Chlamydiota bacterium]|jgi:YidC/Oxa1 family membrane protein insertase